MIGDTKQTQDKIINTGRYEVKPGDMFNHLSFDIWLLLLLLDCFVTGDQTETRYYSFCGLQTDFTDRHSQRTLHT